MGKPTAKILICGQLVITPKAKLTSRLLRPPAAITASLEPLIQSTRLPSGDETDQQETKRNLDNCLDQHEVSIKREENNRRENQKY